MDKSILVIGHAYVIDSNRSAWTKLGLTDSYEVDLLTPKSWKSNLVGGVKANDSRTVGIENIYATKTYFTGSGSFYFYHIFKTFKVLRSKKYHSIVINQESWSLSLFFINIISLFTINRKTNKFLMIAQNLKKSKLRFMIPFERFNLSFIHKALGCCHETKDVLEWKGLFTPWVYFPLYYSKNLKTVPKTSSEILTLGYLGRLSHEKGIETLLQAYSELKEELSLRLVIAGSGPLEKKLNINGVEFMGVLPHSEVQKFYSEIDIFILPSETTKFWKEQFGRVIVESVACGKFVIGSNSGAIPEVMRHLELDYIFEEGDSNSLKNQIKRISNEHKQLNISKHQKLNEKLFSEQAFVDRFIRIINE